MRTKDTKQFSEKTTFSPLRSSNRSDVRPGYINFGSHLNHKNSLKARLMAEIDLAIKEDRI